MTSAVEAMGDAASVSRSESRSERCAGRRRRASISPSGLSALGLWCVLASGRVRGALGQTETSAWLNRAAALQRYIGYDIPLDKLTLTATHNSFSSDRDISTHANFEVVTAQVYGITNQLSCLGVRGLELDLHYIEELAEEGEEESAIRLCHASEDVAEQMLDLCETFGWDVCEEADIFDYGEDTGCRPGAPTAREGFEEVAAWLFLEENASEVVFIKLDSSLNDEDDRISTLVSEVFGDDVIFSPADWEEYSGSEDWPSPAELVELGTRVVIAGSEPSTLVFSTDDDVEEDITSAQDFDANACDEVDDFPEPSWHRVQGDMVEYRLVRGNSTIFELVPGSDEALTATMTGNVMNCGLTPTFDRLDAELMESTVWSWATDRPETGFTESRAAVATVSEGGRWTDVDSSEGGDARHSFACRNSDDDQRHDWVVVPVAPSSSSTNAGSSTISSRRAARRGRRRRLYTSGGYDYDEGDDGYGYGYDTSDNGEVEYSDYSGEFSEAVEACESVGYVFGAPRTAYENAWLRIVMEEAEVDTVWINHTSEGEDAGSSLCWSREGGTSYCVDTSDTCSEEADPVTEVADGELPYFQVGDWEDVDYVRPDYVVPSTVEILHGWVRVAGGNEFDLSERDYVVGIILAAVPVFIFGFIVACCCLPVGHIAASSKEHHVDGSGFFGCFCPSRCKRGDFMGSGTLGVVLFFTIFTIIGGAVAIYGVQSVDSDITHMVSSLQGMGADMVEAQTGVESIYGFLGSVEESFEEISSCSLVSSLEGVEAGISSAKSAVEDLVEDDELGSVGSDILGVEEAFSNTGDTRRGVVYCASALVLVMSAIYVVVGYYALRKDDGRGKEGGASMRGPVLIGCLILPLTLLVILLCWFLFGLSTSVALLTSDFCVAPSEHTTEAFSDPADQEVVAFYTSCEGPNVFSDQLATAYLQGTAAQGLLDAIDDDDFAAECPDDVASKAALDDDIAAILAQIDTLGYLVQCSRVNPYFVEGVEESICVNATSDVWFVIGGFAVVSVGLFIVAVSFRLLLQQKEEGLYKVVFEDELAVSVASSSVYSDDSFSGANGYGNGGKAASSQAGRGAAISAKSLSYNDSSRWGGSGAGKGGGGGGARVGEKQHQHSASSSSSSTLPSSASPTPQGFGGRHGVAAVAVAGAWRDPQQQQPRRSEAGDGGAPGRATPVELAMPLSRSAGGGGKRAASVVSDAGPDEYGGNGARGPSVFDSSSEEDGDGGHRRRGGAGGGVAGAGGGVAGAGGGVAGAAAVSRGRSRRSNGSSNGRSGRHHRDHHGHHHHGHHNHGHHHDDFGSHSGKSRPTRLFRALAGLDDPTEEAPSVIVSRYATQRSTRNLGGGGGSGDVGGSGRLTYTFGRTSSVVGGSNRRNHAAPSSDSGESAFADDFSDHDESRGGGGGGGGHGAGVRRSSAGAGSGRRGTSGRGRGGGGGGEHSANEAAEFSSHGTWAAFSRDCARKGAGGPFLSNSSEVQDPRGRSGRSQRRSSSGGRRESHHHHGTAGAKDPGFEAGGGAPGSPESSTVSGLTGWRRQRLQQRAVSQRSSQRAARDARTATSAAASAAGPGGAGAEARGEAKRDEGSPGPGESGRDGRGSLRKVGGPANARVSARPWHKAGAGAAVQEGGAGAATAPGAPAGAGTGMKGLSALSRPSPAENAAEAKRKLKLKLGSRGSADTSGRGTAAGAKRVDQAITKGTRSPLTSAPRERSASVSQRAAPGGGGGGGGGGGRGRGAGSRAPAAAAGAGAAAGSSVRRAVAVTGTAQGASSRPGTRMTDVLGDRGAGGEGAGGGGGGGGSRNRGPSRSGRYVA